MSVGGGSNTLEFFNCCLFERLAVLLCMCFGVLGLASLDLYLAWGILGVYLL